MAVYTWVETTRRDLRHVLRIQSVIIRCSRLRLRTLRRSELHLRSIGLTLDFPRPWQSLSDVDTYNRTR